MIGKLSITAIQSGLKTARLGRQLILLDTVGSTNDIAWDYASNPDNDGLCVLAENQTRGRGRRGRSWQSAAGQSILCSVLLADSRQPAAMLSLAVSLAAAEAIRLTSGLSPVIKWPNDILVESRKIAGILVESKVYQHRTAFVAGIGINVHQNQTFFDQIALDYPATSIDIETGRIADKKHLIQSLLEQMEHRLDQITADPQEAVACWQQYSRQIGRRIHLECDRKRYGGTCIGIDPAQGLIVQLDGGGIRIFNAAHSSVVRGSCPKA